MPLDTLTDPLPCASASHRTQLAETTDPQRPASSTSELPELQSAMDWSGMMSEIPIYKQIH
jgi:hypothetical protein